MTSERITDKSGFECVDCGKRVLRISYRAACPDCGGALRPIPPPMGVP